MSKPKLEWEAEYSVGVELIDNQHKKMFETINALIDSIDNFPTQEKLNDIIQRLIAYKKFHFSTEEKYFDEFDYEFTEEHKAKHEEFSKKVDEIVASGKEDVLSLAFSLVDFLEDWLIHHILKEDQKYVKCFKEHGL